MSTAAWISTDLGDWRPGTMSVAPPIAKLEQVLVDPLTWNLTRMGRALRHWAAEALRDWQWVVK